MFLRTEQPRRRLHGRCGSSSDALPVALLLLLLLMACAAVETLAQAPAHATVPSTDSTSSPALAAEKSTAAGDAGTPAGRDLLLYGTGSYGTLSSLFFLLSALFTDILIIRVWLVLAYIFLTVNTTLNFPDVLVWTADSSTRKVVLGTMLWSIITLALQLWALVILVWDELPVRLSGDDKLLWQMFYRRCGMTQKEFQRVLALGTWQRFKAGEIVERRDRDEPRLYVVYKGRLDLPSQQRNAEPIPIPSGLIANMYLFNLFGIYMGFENDTHDKALLLAATDVVLFSWDVAALLKISSGQISIALPAYFRSLALYLVSFDYCRLHLGEQPYSSSGQPEPDAAAWLAGHAMSRDFAAPLGPDEQHKTKLWGAIWSMLRSFKLTVPRGLRHQPNPKTGAMARSRVLLAAHMQQHRQHVPAALAHNKAVLAAQGMHLHVERGESLPSRLRDMASGSARRLVGSLSMGPMIPMSSSVLKSSRPPEEPGGAV